MENAIQPRIYTLYNEKEIDISNFVEQFVITTSLSKHMLELYMVLKIDNRSYNLMLDEFTPVKIVLTQSDLDFREYDFNIVNLLKSSNDVIDKMNRTDHVTGIDSMMVNTIVNMKSIAYGENSIIDILKKVLEDNKVEYSVSDKVESMDIPLIEYISPIQSVYKDIEYLSNQVYDLLTYRNKDKFIVKHISELVESKLTEEIKSEKYQWEMIKGKDMLSAISKGLFGYKYTKWNKEEKINKVIDKKITEQIFTNKPVYKREFQNDGIIFNQSTIKMTIKEKPSFKYDVGAIIKFTHNNTHLSGYYVISSVVDRLNKEKWEQELYLSQIVSVNQNRSLF